MKNEKLVSLINTKGVKNKWLAHELNLSESAFRNKLSGRNEFKLSEIKTLKKCLGLSLQEVEEFFF